jgi:hypothetical protein
MTFGNNYVPRDEVEFILWGWDFWDWSPTEIHDLEEQASEEP